MNIARSNTGQREIRGHSAASPGRRGVALMAAVVTLAIIALMMSAIAWQIVASNRVLQHRTSELQAGWLARAGIEHAAAKLLKQSNGYRGETLELLTRSQVTIVIEDVAEIPGAVRVTVEARYPTDSVAVVSRKQTRIFKRSVRDETVVLECVGP